jgi:hypothetical protein
MMNCLDKNDFNIGFGFYGYILWNEKHLNLKKNQIYVIFNKTDAYITSLISFLI